MVRKDWTAGDLSDEELLKQIGELTECRLERKPEKKTILVKGVSTEAVDKALGKLDAEWRSAVQHASLPLIFDFECTEGETNVMLQLLALKELKDRRLATTLIAPSGRLAKSLGSHQIVIMIKDGIVHPTGQPRALDRDTSVECTSKLWKNEDPSSRPPHLRIIDQKKSLKALVAAQAHHTPFLPPGKTGAISQWVEQSALQSASDPFTPTATTQRNNEDSLRVAQQTAPGVQSQVPSMDLHSPPKRAGRVRKPKGIAVEDPVSQTRPDLTASDFHESTDDIDSFMRELYKADVDAMPATGPRAAQVFDESQTKLYVKDSNQAPAPGKKVKADNKNINPAPAAPRTAPVQDKPATATPSTKSYASAARYPNHHDQLPALQPPYMPTTSNSSASTSTTPRWAYPTVSTSKEGTLIDFDTTMSSVEISKGRAQTNPQVASRQFKNTMRQRQPSSRIGHGPQGAISTYENVAMQLLDLVRSIRGSVSLETTIGRLLIDPRSGTGEFRKARFAIAQWPLAFPNKHGVVKLETAFTERLTALASDADFVIDLKLPSGRRMFIEQPCQRKVVYRVICSTSHKSEDNVVIDIDGTKDSTGQPEITKALKLYGAMNWHYPKRYWDARLAIRSGERASYEQMEAATEIVNNLSISPTSDQGIVELSGKFANRILTIQSIQLRRETQHRASVYPDLLLKLCETQEFEIELPRPDSSDICRAYTNSRKQMVRENRLWWEASLVSVKAMKLLKENESLEVGEKTAWTAKDIIIDAEVVRNMSFLSRDIVTSIDSVGYHNKGPKISSSNEQSDPPGTTIGFW